MTSLMMFSQQTFDSQELRTARVAKSMAKERKVYFIEPAIKGIALRPTYFLQDIGNIKVIRPYLPGNTSVFELKEMLISVINELLADEDLTYYSVWTDTPKALPVIRQLDPEFLIYDRMTGENTMFTELDLELQQRSTMVLGKTTAKKISKENIRYLHPSFALSLRGCPLGL